jgi:hypothetical protein
MYKLIALFLILSLSANAQEQLEIHHINVENGDATMIVIHNTVNNTFPFKMLIDGGNIKTEEFLKPYFTNYFGAANIPVTFDYVILSHFHADHYRGLSGLATGDVFKTVWITDPGGYKLDPKYAPIQPGDKKPNRGAAGAKKYITMITDGFDNGYVQKRSRKFDTFPASINKGIELGKINGIALNFTCVAGAGYAYNDTGVINQNSNRHNANNYSLAFILEYGQFRYFTAGDMGGKDAGNCGKYIDQESEVNGGFIRYFPGDSHQFDTSAIANDPNGHICAFKVDHHGSHCSSNDAFLKFAPAAIFTSAGSLSSWGLPDPDFQRRIKTDCPPLSAWTTAKRPIGVSQQGIYFTNLYNFPKKDDCRDSAIANFYNKDGIFFSYGNNYTAAGVTPPAGTWKSSRKAKDKDSYVLIVDTTNIKKQSTFKVVRVNYNKVPQQTPAGNFLCHKKDKP